MGRFTVETKVYLAHPYAKMSEGLKFQKLLGAQGLTVLNPFERGEQDIYNAKLAPGGPGLDDDDCRRIVTMDLEAIDRADGVVALMIDPSMLGTIMEIFYAGNKGKPVFIYTTEDRYARHPW